MSCASVGVLILKRRVLVSKRQHGRLTRICSFMFRAECGADRKSFDGVCHLLFAEEIFSGGLGDEAGVFKLEVGALDFAFVD